MDVGSFAKFIPVSYTTPQSMLVVAGAGVLGECTIHTPWASGTAILYDSQSGAGNIIANITYPSSVANIGPSSPMSCNVQFKSGLFLVTTGTGGIVFISYRLGN